MAASFELSEEIKAKKIIVMMKDLTPIFIDYLFGFSYHEHDADMEGLLPNRA